MHATPTEPFLSSFRRASPPRLRLVTLSFLTLLFAVLVPSSQAQQGAATSRPRVVVFGRDTAVGYMSDHAARAGIDLVSLDLDDVVAVRRSALDGATALVFLWGSRRGRGGSAFLDDDSVTEALRGFVRAAHRDHPELHFVASGAASRSVADWFADAVPFTTDEAIDDYLRVGIDRANLRRLASYLAVRYAGQEGEVESADPDPPSSGLHHPDHEGLFAGVDEFLAWSEERGRATTAETPRAILVGLSVHYVTRNRLASDALIRALDARGVLACIYVEGRRDDGFVAAASELGADLVVDTRHRGSDSELFARLGVPVMHAIWLRDMSIEEWLAPEVAGGTHGRRHASISPRMLMGVATAEAAGTIGPFVVSGQRASSDASGDVFDPIDERIERLADRATKWIALGRKPAGERRIAMFVGAMKGGTGDNQLLDMPASIHAVLGALEDAGFDVSGRPADALRLYEHWSGLVIDARIDAELDRLARSGDAARIPVAAYLDWYERFVPKIRRDAVEKAFGPPPGRWRVWRDDDGVDHFVVPYLQFGHIALVGTGGRPPSAGVGDMAEVRRRMNDDDAEFAPSHNTLATRFWLEHGAGCDAVVHWGSFQGDLLMPQRTLALGPDDWPDILTGTLPDIRPFSMAAITFAQPARRRTTSVLIDHLTPPLESAGLADELLTLARDVQKWGELGEGALREEFRRSITEQALAAHLDVDLGLALEDGTSLEPDQIAALTAWLGRIENERITTTSHTFGQVPRGELLVDQLVTIAGRHFVDDVARLCPDLQDVTDTARRRTRAAAVVDALIRLGHSAEDALDLAGAELPGGGVPEDLDRDLALIAELHRGYQRTGDELTHFVAALSASYVPPGPAGPPERNPSAVPSGRNITFVNPEELPSQASWKLAGKLVDSMLEQSRAERGGAWPRRVALVVTPRHSLSDYGISEAQAFRLIGVEPVWSRGRVSDFEIVPREELGRPRIDVLLESKHHYTNYLETRAQLLDRAIRAVRELDEPGNYVRRNRLEVRDALVAAGETSEQAEILAGASIFSTAPDRFGSGLHDKLFSATGVWESREELTEVYLAEKDTVYTEGHWGEPGVASIRHQLERTDVVLKSLDSRGALGGRSHYSGGMLSAAVEVLSGEQPGYYVTDTRIYGEERVEAAETALRRDYRAVLFNRKWIEGMQKEGRNGAHRMASMIGKTLKWEVARAGTITPDIWETIVDIYLDDARDVGMREFLEQHDPGVIQDIASTMLEAVRKEYWRADRATTERLAAEYARSVAEHGQQVDDNHKRDRFVEGSLRGAANPELDQVLAALQAAETAPRVPRRREPRAVEATTSRGPDAAPDVSAGDSADVAPVVAGPELAQRSDAAPQPVPIAPLGAPAAKEGASRLGILVAVGALLLFALVFGALTRRGAA